MVEPTLKITPINWAKKTFSVVATYTDSEDPDNPKIISVSTAILDTQERKLGVLDSIADSYQSLLIKDTNMAALINDAETNGAANLKARL